MTTIMDTNTVGKGISETGVASSLNESITGESFHFHQAWNINPTHINTDTETVKIQKILLTKMRRIVIFVVIMDKEMKIAYLSDQWRLFSPK